MSGPFDISGLFNDAESIAALVRADRLFGLLRRTLELPADFAALVARRTGDQTVYAPGRTIDGQNAADVLLVRAAPFDVSLRIERLATSDQYLAEADVALRLRILPERGEMEAFRNVVLGSTTRLTTANIERYLHNAVDQALRQTAKQHPAADLVDGARSDDLVTAVQEALREGCFAGGMALDAEPQVRLRSAAYAQVRKTEEQTACHLHEHAARSQIQAALAAAQREKLDRLETMLTKVQSLANQSPSLGLPALLRTFDEAQRGQLYQALFQSPPPRRVTRWIVVAAGSDLLFFNPDAPQSPARSIRLDGPAGAIRSVQVVLGGSDGAPVILAGGVNGVYEIPADAGRPRTTYLFDPDVPLRGGINAVAVRGDDVVATHSEYGVIWWRRHEPGQPVRILADLTRSAQAVRCALFAGDRFWCSVNDRIASLPAGDLNAAPTVFAGSQSVISSLSVHGPAVYAGNAHGEILAWDSPDNGLPSPSAPTPAAPPQTLHSGSRRPAETACVLNLGGIDRLFYTDTSLAVFCRVLGDTFVCRYEAGGQTIRRAEIAPDLIVGTTDARDRLLVWSPNQPAQPVEVLPISRLTGRSVQDVALVPA